MYKVDLGDGYFAVPEESVCFNGLYLSSLNKFTKDYSGRVALLLPDGKAAMGEDGRRPYIYTNLAECIEDKKVLQEVLTPTPLKKCKKSRGYFGIGIYNPKKEINIGVLFRSAYCFNANFIYTIGSKYKRDKSDTPNTTKHIPYFNYESIEEFISQIPDNSTLVCVENTGSAIPLQKFSHPSRAVYLLGSEVSGIPSDLTSRFPTVIIPSQQCLNVSVCGSIILYDRLSKSLK